MKSLVYCLLIFFFTAVSSCNITKLKKNKTSWLTWTERKRDISSDLSRRIGKTQKIMDSALPEKYAADLQFHRNIGGGDNYVEKQVHIRSSVSFCPDSWLSFTSNEIRKTNLLILNDASLFWWILWWIPKGRCCICRADVLCLWLHDKSTTPSPKSLSLNPKPSSGNLQIRQIWPKAFHGSKKEAQWTVIN